MKDKTLNAPNQPIKLLDNILSYLYPITVETCNSTWNPVLEILLSNGKYLLNSANANYSYGSLHSLFEKTFRKLKLDWTTINNVLILGYGAGSIASIIGKYKHNCIIDGVEIDSKVTELGKKYFNTHLLKNVTIHCANASAFIVDCQKKYDLIIIDVYRDINVPKEMEAEQFLIDVKNTMNTGGMVIFNKFVSTKISKDQIPKLKKLYEKIFDNLKIMTFMGTGKIFVAYR